MQFILLLPLLLITLIAYVPYYKTLGWHCGLLEIWKRSPGWLIFSTFMINTLVICGFIACYLVHQKAGLAPSRNEIIPLLSALLNSIGFVLTYTYLIQKTLPSTYAQRNSERGTIPLEWHELWKK